MKTALHLHQNYGFGVKRHRIRLEMPPFYIATVVPEDTKHNFICFKAGQLWY